MKLVIFGSKAYNELVARIENLERSIADDKYAAIQGDDDWVDGDTVCRYLGISSRTLQRLRSDRVISYSALKHKIYYTLGEIKRVLHEHSVERNKK